MPTSLFFHCPGCNARIKAPINLLGRCGVCPGCKTRFIVRNERRGKPEDAEPVLVADDRPSRAAMYDDEELLKSLVGLRGW